MLAGSSENKCSQATQTYFTQGRESCGIYTPAPPCQWLRAIYREVWIPDTFSFACGGQRKPSGWKIQGQALGNGAVCFARWGWGDKGVAPIASELQPYWGSSHYLLSWGRYSEGQSTCSVPSLNLPPPLLLCGFTQFTLPGWASNPSPMKCREQATPAVLLAGLQAWMASQHLAKVLAIAVVHSSVSYLSAQGLFLLAGLHCTSPQGQGAK